MDRYDDVNTSAVVVVGFVSAILLFGIVVGVQALYFNYEHRVSESQAARFPEVESSNLIAEQEARLKRQGWLNAEKTKVAISIERAMRLIVEETRRRQKSEGGTADAKSSS